VHWKISSGKVAVILAGYMELNNIENITKKINIITKNNKKILSRLGVCDYRWVVDWMLDLLKPLRTTSNYSTTADLNTAVHYRIR
jgi:hypothetical protein